MIRWRNVFIALLISGWAHGLVAAILFTVRLADIGGFCVFMSGASFLALLPVGHMANDQADNWMLDRAKKAEDEARRLRAELAELHLKEEG